jgi:hypothetical protein
MNKLKKISDTLVGLSILYFFVWTPNTGLAQSNTIQKRIYLPKSNNAYSRDIIETTPGNFVLIGQSVDSIGGQLQKRLTLAGTDNNGNLIWRKSYGSNAFAYSALTGSSRYILKHKGFLYNAAFAQDSTGKTPGTLIKFNFNGDTLWQKKYYQSNPTALSYFTSVCPSVDNGFLITGSIQTNTPGFNNHPTVGLYLLKTDLNGNKLWDKTIYKSNLDLTQAGSDIVQDSLSKKIIVVGNQSYSGGGVANVLILDSLGNTLVQKGMGGGPNFFGNGLMNLIKTRDGNFISTGSVDYPFVNGDPTSSSTLVKFDIDGNIIFRQEYDTISFDNFISRVAELPDGSLITGGSLEVDYKYNYQLNNLLRITKLDKNGNELWKKYFDNYRDLHNQDGLLGLCLTSNLEIAFTSFCECPEPAPIQFIFYRTDTSNCDVNAVACYSPTTVSVRENGSISEQLMLYPNPAINYCRVKLKSSYSSKITKVSLRNVLGELVFEDNTIHSNELNLDLNRYSPGIYYVSIISDKKIVSEQKLMIIR